VCVGAIRLGSMLLPLSRCERFLMRPITDVSRLLNRFTAAFVVVLLLCLLGIPFDVAMSQDPDVGKSGAAASVTGIDFENDIIPVLTSGGCNSGPCHGKSRGQNGFALSLFGFDADFDFNALAKEGRGRRVFATAADRSLLLLKPIGEVPHGGGRRLEAGSAEYELLKKWIEAGMPRRQPDAPKLLKVEVQPTDRSMRANEKQALTVTAIYSNGSRRDVTRLAAFQSNESAIASVDKRGLVQTTGVTGEAAIMSRYMGEIAVTTISVPMPSAISPDVYAKLPRNNYIDELVWKKLARLNLAPSSPAPEHSFLRRAYIDIIGRVPSNTETRTFLSDTSADKRNALIVRLLASPEYSDHWAN
jgi:hypothetical protein